MSAIIIYPTAFCRSESNHTHDAVSLAQAAPARRATVDVLADMRQASANSSQNLGLASREIAIMRRSEDELASHASDLAQTSKNLGVQMERLIEETRRMVAYLRADA